MIDCVAYLPAKDRRLARAGSLAAGALLVIGAGCSSIADITPRPGPEAWETAKPPPPPASRGDEAFLRGDFGEAIRLYREDLEGPSRSPAAMSPLPWKNYAHALYAEGETDRALRAFREAVQRAPRNEDPYGEAQLGVARCELLLDDFEEAARAAQAALDSGTADEAWASEVLGVALQRMGRFAEADRHYLHAMAVGGDGDAAWRARDRKGVRTFSVQAGSYRSVKAAGTMQDSLRAAGLSSRLARIEHGGDVLYRVLVGEVATYPQAKELLAKVRAVAGIEDAIVFP